MPAAITTPTTLRHLVEQSQDIPIAGKVKEEESIERDGNAHAAAVPAEEDKAVMEVIRRREVIKLVSCMNATVGAKTAEQGLLRMKQVWPLIRLFLFAVATKTSETPHWFFLADTTTFKDPQPRCV